MNFFSIKKMAPYFLVAVFFVAIDRFLKNLALLNQKKINLAGDIFAFNFSENYNIAFSLPLRGTILTVLIVLMIFILLYFFVDLYKKNQYRQAGILIILIFGAMSNLWDRLRFGFVVDYLDLKYFTVFNIADIIIVGSVIALIVINYRK